MTKKQNFINNHPAILPCFLGFNSSKRVTAPLIIAKELILAKELVFVNLACTNSGSSDHCGFSVSFKYRTFNERNFDEFYNILLNRQDLGFFNLGLYYSISFRFIVGSRKEGFNYRVFGGNSEFLFNSDESFKVLFDKTYDKLHDEFDALYLRHFSNSKRIVLFFQPIAPTAPKIINKKITGGVLRTKVNPLSCSQRRSYFTSTKVNSIDKDKWLRDGYLLEEAGKEIKEEFTEEIKEFTEEIVNGIKIKIPKSKVINRDRIINLNGIVFNIENNELRIDFSHDINYKKAYVSIELILSDIQKTDSKGFLNDINLNNFPVISDFINSFIIEDDDDEENGREKYITGNKVSESYKWIFNVLMTSLYEYSLKILYNLEQDYESESDLMANFKTLNKNIFDRIDPSIRIKFQKRGISIIQNIYTGFDTEFKYIKPGSNELISVQLATNTKSLLKIPKYSEYELCSIDTISGEEYKINIKNEKEFRYSMVEQSLNRSIKEIRSLKYKNNDSSISILIEGLKYLNIPFIEKDDVFVFSFPRTPIQPFVYYNKEGKGYSIEDIIKQSNLIGEPYLKVDYEKLIDLLKRISSLSLNISDKEETFKERFKEDHDWIENHNKGYKILDALKTERGEVEKAIGVKRMTRTFHSSFTEEKVSVTKIRNNYIIAHWTVPDLPMMNDFENLKEDLVDIVNNSFVTLGKPLEFQIFKDIEPEELKDNKNTTITTKGKVSLIKGKPGDVGNVKRELIGNTNVIIRDTMLLAPQGHKSLESVGSLYGEDFKKVDITKDLTEDEKERLTSDLSKDQKENLNLTEYLKGNMDLLLRENKDLFDSYAIKDAIIPLIHASYMEDFNFKLNAIGIPITLSSLASTYVKYHWKIQGYKGYQISPKYLLGDSSATQTPKGLFTTSTTGLKLSYYIANYKGGRNESFMYGGNNKIKTIDYDLTSAYTTAMACLGNPDYKKGRMISLKELEKMSFNEILYSYVIMKAKFKFKAETKFPSIPASIDETTTVYPLEGEAILTGPEYLVAKNQKCKLNISEIYYLPFEQDKDKNLINQPFKNIIKEIQGKRRQYRKGTIENLTYKEMGNSQYGSTARGISNKKKFDIKSGVNLRMEASDLSNPIIVSWTTAFIRSVIGECLEKISRLKGKVVSVTTDGFITNIDKLERKIIGVKPYFINQLKSLEMKIKDDDNFMFNNFVNIKEEISQLNQDQTISLLNNLKSIHSDILGVIKQIISDLKWEGEETLLKEYEKIRLELSGDPSGLEIKKGIKQNEIGEISISEGIISITTRVQLGKESGIRATTGFQAKDYTLEELEGFFKDKLKSEDKWLEFIQFSLRSALDIYKHGGHCTPIYKDKIFRLHYDNKRIIILPKEYENTIDFSNILLDSNPLPNVEKGKILRFLSKYHKQRLYNKQTSISSDNKYKSYTELAVRNFIKILLTDPQKYNINAEFSSYSEIIDFIRDFDSEIKITKQSISNLKNRKMIFKTVPRTIETLEFVKYVKTKYKDFNEQEFFKNKK